ncbi:hypothetical protein PRK78_004700 [Emydomyces testavorans]|uniref:Uncharacterized protein n=1 Tax=Emydomyces testavorans TaxID=2070801 RepID=A0AAF0IK11_9EURO|nr:hypothetical protein PRK78_004700 [Emydomyces testavorans]
MLRILLTLSSLLTSTTLGLRFTPGSPCADACGTHNTNITGDEVVCRDVEFSTTPEGTRFQDCVKCELRSTHEDRESYQSDLKWGLYNLRYAFSSCIFNFPTHKQSLSTPCQVTCNSLQEAIEYGLVNPRPQAAYDFCGLDSLSDDFVTKCALCFSFILEAVRDGCRSKVPAGHPFVIDPDRIFNTTLLPPTTKSISPTGGASHGKKALVIVIVLPIVGFLILCLITCFCCFFFIRRRRRKARRTSQTSHLHERWNDTSMATPMGDGLRQTWGEPSPPMHTTQANGNNVGYDDGYYHGQQDIKYPTEAYQMGPVPHYSDDVKKADFVSPTVPKLSAPPPRKSLSTPE